MPKFIIHKDGVYNLFTTIADGACYQSGLTLEQLRGPGCLNIQTPGQELDFQARLNRVHETGCSGIGYTLKSIIAGNRSGPNESEVPYDEFIQKYLTIQAEDSAHEAAMSGKGEADAE